MLETIELRKVFKGHVAVDAASLYIGQGEAIGLLGPNGAGKSTTISMMSSLMKPSAGDVVFQGQSVVKNPRHLRSVLGVVPQEIAVYEELSAYENLQFFGRIYGLQGTLLKKRIQAMLELVGLADRQKDLIGTYSGGMKRRINIAASLLHEPTLVIMDEPTVGIDPQSRSYILDMVRQLNQEKNITVIYTSHYMEEVERLCSRVYIMDHGKIIASGTNDELKNILSGEESIVITFDRRALDSAIADLKATLQAHSAVRKVETTEDGIRLVVPKQSRLLGDAFQAAERHQVQISNVQVEVPSLEDVFLHMTGRTLRD